MPYIHPLPPAPPSPLLAVRLGPTRIVASSSTQSWRGILLEKHFCSPGERASALIDRHVISLSIGGPSRFEHRTAAGPYAACLHRPGTVMITPAGRIPDIRLHTTAEFIHCALEEAFVRGVSEELEVVAARPVFRPGIEDKPVQRILGMLMDELLTERPLGRLYVDSLAHALAARYVQFDCPSTDRPRSQLRGLVPRVLNRVREKIEANLDADLSLECLAEESGYSRAHFLRMFRAATGMTPHQYVLDLRLCRAKDFLKRKHSSIIDVAMSCGFSSQSHMTSAFRQRLGMTPGEFRRNA